MSEIFSFVKEYRSGAYVNSRVVFQETLLVSEMQQRAMGDFIVLVYTTSPLGRVPCIKVRIKMNNSDFAPDRVKGSQRREGYADIISFPLKLR